VPAVRHDTKHCPTSKNQEDRGDEKYKAGTCCTTGGLGLTLQQAKGTMRALQDEMAASRANQERIQADLVALQATSKELRRSNEELR